MGATKTLLADFKGLVTAPGLLMRSEASCTVAKNVLFDAPGVLRKRPGFSRLAFGVGGPIYQVHSSPGLGARFLVHYGSAVNPGTLRLGDGTVATSLVASIDPQPVSRPAALRQQLALLGYNHYVTSDEGVRRVEHNLTTARYAGMPRGLGPSTANMDIAVFTVLQAANPWLSPGSAVAYRVTWHRLDDSGLELGGAPTGRTTIRNISGTTGWVAATSFSVRLRIPIPYEYGSTNTALTTSYFFRLWRTRDFASSEPDDEMALVAQYTLQAGDIAAGYVQLDDVTPSSLLAAAPKLHTNPVGFPDGEANIKNGQTNADDAPPAANAIASWRECVWYGDTQGKSASSCQLLSVGGTGLVAGDTVSFNGGTDNLTAVAGAPAGAQFTVVAGLATLALNIEATARNIVEAWNLNYGASTDVFAYYISVGSQQPGLIFFECKRQSDSTAVGASSRPAAWRFGPGYTRTGGPNTIQYSKAGRADACAIVNTLVAGGTQNTILRLVPYRDMLLVFTTEGIYVVTGSSWADFNIAPFDLTFRLLGRDLVAVSDDKVYAWCLEGIVEIDEGGCRVVSLPIEPTLTSLLGATPSTYADYSFAVAYRLAHRVIFFVASAVGSASVGYVFDTRTRAWSTMEFEKGSGGTTDYQKSAGVVRFSDDRLVFTSYGNGGGDGYFFQERRALDNTDYQDTNAANVTDPVNLLTTFQFQVPDSEGAVHWQQTVVYLDGGEFTWRAAPSTFGMRYTTEWSQSIIAVTPAASALVTRVEPAAAVRRGNRMAVQLGHTQVEAFGINGLSQSVRIGSKFARST